MVAMHSNGLNDKLYTQRHQIKQISHKTIHFLPWQFPEIAKSKPYHVFRPIRSVQTVVLSRLTLSNKISNKSYATHAAFSVTNSGNRKNYISRIVQTVTTRSNGLNVKLDTIKHQPEQILYKNTHLFSWRFPEIAKSTTCDMQGPSGRAPVVILSRPTLSNINASESHAKPSIYVHDDFRKSRKIRIATRPDNRDVFWGLKYHARHSATSTQTDLTRKHAPFYVTISRERNQCKTRSLRAFPTGTNGSIVTLDTRKHQPEQVPHENTHHFSWRFL